MTTFLRQALILLSLFSGVASASKLEVMPLHIVQTPAQRTGVLTITNHDTLPTTIQVRAFAWAQTGGIETRTPTKDVRFSPALVTLQPGQTQVVRFLRSTPDGADETAYRLDVSELPPPTSAGAASLARVRLTFDFPLFFRPDGAQPQLAARWDGNALVVRNSGASTAQLAALGPVQGAPWIPGLVGYVLPGAEMRFAVPVRDRPSSVAVTINRAVQTLAVR